MSVVLTPIIWTNGDLWFVILERGGYAHKGETPDLLLSNH